MAVENATRDRKYCRGTLRPVDGLLEPARAREAVAEMPETTALDRFNRASAAWLVDFAEGITGPLSRPNRSGLAPGAFFRTCTRGRAFPAFRQALLSRHTANRDLRLARTGQAAEQHQGKHQGSAYSSSHQCSITNR